MKEGQKAKRIAIVASSCPPIVTGGISSAHYNLYRALKRRGFIVKVFTYTDHNNHLDVDDDILRFGTPKLLLKMLNIVTIFYHSVLLRIETFQHAYQFPYILESACGSLKVSRALRSFKPNVLILPDNGAPGFFIKKVAHCTSVFISHHNFLRLTGEPLLGKFARRDAQLSHRIEKKSLKKIDKVICPSNYMKAIFNQTHNFDGPVAVIPNIVDAALIDTISANDIRKVLSLPDNAPVIYIPSAGSSLKGSQFVFELIRRIAAACGREIGFYLSGDIDDLVKRELCFVPPNAKIFAPGHSSYNENISVVKACSFCVSPTLIESFGLAILEANFCGLPVVTFDVGGTADIIVNGENGILVPFLDIEALIFYSIQLLNDNLIQKMRLSTLKLISDNFDNNKITDQYIEFMFGADGFASANKGKTGRPLATCRD